MRYRILYTDSTGNHFNDIESNSFPHALWELAIQLGSSEKYAVLVDTMLLPSKETTTKVPTHVNLHPNWVE